jgi:hypothetical protein
MTSGLRASPSGRATKLDDRWYETEERTGTGMVRELQRIHRRSRVHKLLVIGVALVMTAGVMTRVITRERLVRAQVVLAELIQRHGFWAVLLGASVPNPLFDLAGLMCGHFNVPFATGFGTGYYTPAAFLFAAFLMFAIFFIFGYL